MSDFGSNTRPPAKMHEKKKLFFQHASNDMEEVIAGAKYLTLENESVGNNSIHIYQLHKVIETGLITAYSRPFTQTNFKCKFGDSEIAHLEKDAKLLHKEILDLRDRRYAHTDIVSERVAGINENGEFYEGWKPISKTKLLKIIELSEKNRDEWRKLIT